MRLCGISSRFQLLSPCTRQVTHALLTRPPLSHKIISPEGNQIKCFVRLACVKHAASVHPEPGSNSHVWVFSLQLCCLVKTNFVLLSEVFSSLVKGSILVKLNLANSFIQIESEFTVLKVFNFHWSVLIDSQNLSRFLTVQLSMFFVCSLATAWLFYQIAVRLSSTFFELCFKFSVLRQLVYSIKMFFICQELFHNLFNQLISKQYYKVMSVNCNSQALQLNVSRESALI